ncbi:hypothetical protein chiPu_0004644 [Chiloscyllium punctatum]|uniref:SRCR domain-containing protein n=1 Tax=Chiloscyllium punctatum TaxID=137246 RepID=A0A401S770_CHIPU|nr:hypothetical protein [Chiloscyllium punctatum]
MVKKSRKVRESVTSREETDESVSLKPSSPTIPMDPEISTRFPCRCKMSKRKTIITVLSVITVIAILVVAIYFVKVAINEYYYFCSETFKFIPRDSQCNGILDCSEGEDERECVMNVTFRDPFPVRIYGSKSILQVRDSETQQWKSICYDNWRPSLAEVTCKQLGYSNNPIGNPVDKGLWPLHKIVDFSKVTNPVSIQNVLIEGSCSSGNIVSLVCAHYIRPVCLPNYASPVPKKILAWVTGWGYTKEFGKVSTVLQQANVSVIGREICNSLQYYGGQITEQMLCAGYQAGKVDACQGDSGGPLVLHVKSWRLIGIVSWGSGCARPNRPGVYSNVGAMLDWIYQVLNMQE